MYLADLAITLFFAIITACACVGVTSLLLGVRRTAEASPLEKSRAVQLIAGLPIFGSLLFIVGALSTGRAAITAVTIPLAIVGVMSLRRRERGQSHDAPRDLIGIVLLTICGGITLLFAQTPPVALDELAYHLAVPMIWSRAGAVIQLPLLSHSYFPFGSESADLFSLSWLQQRGGLSSHFVHAAVAAALVVLLARFITTRSNGYGRWTLVAAIVSTPALLLTTGWSWSDVPVIAAAAVLFVALDDFVAHDRGLRLVALALAAGLLTKYTFAPAALLLVVIAFVTVDRERRWRLFIATLAGGIGGSLFYVRNLIVVRNPFAPLFGVAAPHVVGYRATGNAITTIGSYIFDKHFVDETLGFGIALLLVCALLARDENRYGRLAAFGFTALALLVGAAAPSARILLPFLLIPAIIGAGAVARAEGVTRRAFMALLIVAAVLQLGVALIYTAAQDPLAVVRGRKSIPEYLAAHRRSYNELELVDRSLPPHSKTLVVGLQELFWFTHEVRGGGNFDGPLIAAYLREPSASALSERLRHDRFTHIAVVSSGIRVGAPSPDIKLRERETVLDPSTANTFSSFLRRQQLIARGGNALVFRLR